MILLNKSLRKIFYFFLVFISVYSLKIPKTKISFYSIVFPILGFLIILTVYKRHSSNLIFGTCIKRTYSAWSVILIWGTLLSFINDLGSIASEYLVYDFCFIMIVLCFAFFSENDCGETYLIKSFFIISLVIGLSGVYEAFTGNYYHITRESLLFMRNSFGLYKPNTIFYNINDSSTFMCLALIISFLYSEKTNKKYLIQIIALIVFGCNIVMTESRGGEFGAIIFLCIYFNHIINKSSRKTITFIFMILPIVIMGGVWLISLIDFSDLSEWGGRKELWIISYNNLKKTFYLGVGPGNTVALNESFGGVNGVAAVHNFFLEMLCDYGIFGFMALIIWYYKNMKMASQIIKSNSGSMIPFCGFISFIPMSVSSSSLIGKVWIIPFFSLLLIEIDKSHKLYQDYKINE